MYVLNIIFANYNHYGFHELYECASSNSMIWLTIYYISHNYNPFFHHEQYVLCFFKFSQESHFKSLLPPWIVLMCLFKSTAWVNNFLQDSHLKSLLPLWIVLMCLRSVPASENAFPHDSHLKSLWPLWTESICFFNFPTSKNAFPQESHLWFF